jgi:hypothetical protein
MTDHDFLTALGIQSLPGDDFSLLLRTGSLSDAASDDCGEARTAEHAKEIEACRQMRYPKPRNS